MFRDNISKQGSACKNTFCQLRKYSLVFMDLNMPVMDGFNSAEKMIAFQKKFAGSHTQTELGEYEHWQSECNIIALTAFVNPENVERCSRIGMA